MTAPHCPPTLYSSSTFPPNRRLEVEREGGRKEGSVGYGAGSRLLGIDVMVVWMVGRGEDEEETEEK